jgi:tetratricopeptide (TPR) repeat protein
MTHVLLGIALLLLAGPCLAGLDDRRFQEANAAYSRNDFTEAIAVYEELAAAHGFSDALLYNLANSYAQSGMIGRAVLNYERALRLAPGDPDIVANLQLVRSANGLFTREERAAERFFNLLSMNQWIGLGVTALILLTLVLLISLRLRLSGRALTIHCLGCTLVMLVATIAVVEMRHQWRGSVVLDESKLLISPFAEAASAGSIQAGRLVQEGKRHEGYVYVEDETGRKGWLAHSAIEPVIPRLSGDTR